MMLKISGWGNVELKILEFVYIRDSTSDSCLHRFGHYYTTLLRWTIKNIYFFEKKAQ